MICAFFVSKMGVKILLFVFFLVFFQEKQMKRKNIYQKINNLKNNLKIITKSFADK
jgi:preprotein translocase subunit YajC